MKNRFILTLVLFAALLASCAPVDLNAPIPAYDTGIDPTSWAQVPAGEFYFGQHEDVESTDAYEIMVTDVAAQQYADYLNAAVADGTLKIEGDSVLGYYPGDETLRENANFYASRDPFEDMSSFGSRTSPVGFYNGQTYNGYVTLDSKSPYGLYDMAGNVWQWIGNVMEGFSDRFMKGGSKDTYDMDLRIWVRNSAPPMYFSPGVGFRCVR